MQVKKSVTRLLAERKALEGRITKATGNAFIGVQKGSDSSKADVINMSGKSVEQARALFKSQKDKVDSLIAYHRRITAALVKSNAITEVRIAGETMSVAAAVERKNSIHFDKALLATAIKQAQDAQYRVNLANEELERRIDTAAATLMSGDKAKVTTETRASVAKPMEESGKHIVIDPLNLTDWISKEMDRISQFETEIDFILSEINAKTEIEINDDESTTPATTSSVTV